MTLESTSRKLTDDDLRFALTKSGEEFVPSHLATIVRGTDDGFISTRLDGTITSWNRGAELLYGYSAAEAIGSNIAIVYPESERGRIAEVVSSIARGNAVQLKNGPRMRRDGSSVLVETRVFPWRSADGVIIGCSAISRDVSERHRREEELAQSREFLERTQEIGHIGSWRTTIGPESILQLTPEGNRILGITDGSSLRNIDFFNLVHPDDRQMVVETFIRVRSERRRDEVEARIIRSDGSVRWLYLAVDAVVDATGVPTAMTGVLQDVTERKEVEAGLLHGAFHDTLTGLPNRYLLLDRVAQSLSRAESERNRVALLFVDLDRFERFNNTRGHEFGDALLRAVASRVSESLRPTDAVARFGADEYVILCEGIESGADAVECARRILTLFEKPFVIEGGETYITASIGVALSDPGTVPDALIRDADLAMYQAKEHGRNRFELYDLGLRQQAEKVLAVEAGLRRALENDELFLEYQPIFSVCESRIVGAEALVRWRDPDEGVIPPDSFIPLAEETGLIGPIGTWVIGEACRELRRWQDAISPREVTMSINVSPAQLRDETFAKTVAAAIAETGIDGTSLRLELTESILVDGSGIESVLHELRELGPRLSIDDFGTKYSAFGYLSRLPIDELKIDRAFVAHAVADRSDNAVVSAIVALGRALGLHITAEGVETPEQLDLIRGVGCDAVQGFYFSVPLAADACLEMIKENAQVE
jgi:diguanylate cyclase (GGDEF)-like protein/PAS domain S-box-containing protein